MQINIKENKEQIIKLLRSTNRNGMEQFIKWLEGTDFFVAPASSKFHLNVEGGLAYHSLRVYETFDKLCAMFQPKIPIDTRIIAALLHDVCKINLYQKVKEVVGEVRPYEYKEYYNRDDEFPVGHGDKSVILMLQQGLELTNQEILMIRWHMAMYDQSYYGNAEAVKKVCPEAKLLYFADDISTQYLEE